MFVDPVGHKLFIVYIHAHTLIKINIPFTLEQAKVDNFTNQTLYLMVCYL